VKGASPIGRFFGWIRSRRYRRFWLENCDRRYMQSTTYPALARWLSEIKSPQVLDIGCRWYTARVRDLLSHPDLTFWGVDIAGAPLEYRCDHFRMESVIGLALRHPELAGRFDAVISYGVLGFVPLKPPEVSAYLQSLVDLLKPSGCLLLKLDESRLEKLDSLYHIDQSEIFAHFQLLEIQGLPASQRVEGEGHRYQFFTLAPKSKLGTRH